MVDEVEAFKNELRNLRFYEKKIKEIEEEIKILDYEAEGVKGVDYSKQHGTANPAAIENKKLSMIEKREELVKRKNALWVTINNVFIVLARMDKVDRDVVERLYVEKKTMREMCDELGIKNASSLKYAVDKAIKTAIKKSK